MFGRADDTFADVRAEVVCLDGAHDALACFVSVDVQSVQVFADIVHGFEVWVDGAADMRLDAEVLSRARVVSGCAVPAGAVAVEKGGY